MASIPKEQSDREDGEIIEDEFEDISDNSIILTAAGKCISPKEHLPEISLSSVSEAEDMEKFRQQRCRISRNRRIHRKRKYSHRKTICLDSDSDEYVELDRKLLRAAIHIDNPDCLKNSLHTRLKAMTQVDDDSNKKHENDQPKEIQCQNISSDDGDDDLFQLRLEALRTAVLNKFKHRKKTKSKEISESDEFEEIFSDNSEKTDDKENAVEFSNDNPINKNDSTNQEISSKNQACVDSDTQNSPQEEDEDVLRALLLASLSKKISKESNIESLQLQPPNVIKDIYSYNKTVQSNDKKYMNNINPYKKTSVTNKNLPLQHSKVQPIIININCDSDTEDESQNTFTKLPQKRPSLTIENSVEKFLKEQRAKVEAENNKGEEFKSDFFNKSSLKLLPKIKQIEYQNLLKKLQDAQKLKQRQKKKLNNFSENKVHCNSVYTKNSDDHQSFNLKKNRNRNTGTKTDLKTQKQNSDQIPDLRNEVRLLHKVLKEIQTQKSVRLQMQTKYTSLTPIVKKINEASIERKKCNKEIGRLLGELSEAKKKLRETHISISTFVKELLLKKEKIDKTSTNIPNSATTVHYTSTPLKNENPVEISKNNIQKLPAQINLVVNNNEFDSSLLTEHKIDSCETEMTISIGISDDNDHNYSRTKAIVPKYISPLDNIERLDMDDPFLIMCPYDIDGNCRDPECVYKHYRISH